MRRLLLSNGVLLRGSVAVCLCFCSISAFAQRLGQTRQQIIAENGAPTGENLSSGTAIYRHGSLKVDLTYDDGVARKLVFTAPNALDDDLIREILALSARGGSWHELHISGPIRRWQGPNFARAECERINARALTLYAGLDHQAVRDSASVRSASSAVSAAPTASRPRFGATEKSTAGLTMSAIAAGIFPVLLGAAFPLVIVGLVLVFVLRRVLPWIWRGYTAAPVVIVERTSDLIQRDSSIGMRREAHEPATLDSIGWDKFELLVGELFRRKGYEVEVASGLGADGGKDLTVRKEGRTYLVQCKNLARDNRVTASQIRDFFGLITAERAAEGFFVTTGYFSADARKFAQRKSVNLIDRAGIKESIEQLSAPGENLCLVSSWIDSFAANARIVDPACPFCEKPMKLRRGALGRLFWGCSGFPRCRGRRDGREELLQARRCQGG